MLDKLPSLTSRQTVPGQVDRVDVDGGAGSNRVIVNLAEALTSVLINVHHSDGQGRENLAGVNQLTINGTAQDETFLLRAGYLAKLTPQGAGYADAVQRVNYDRTSTGGLRLNAVDGGNRFYIDDTGTQVVIDGGAAAIRQSATSSRSASCTGWTGCRPVWRRATGSIPCAPRRAICRAATAMA